MFPPLLLMTALHLLGILDIKLDILFWSSPFQILVTIIWTSCTGVDGPREKNGMAGKINNIWAGRMKQS